MRKTFIVGVLAALCIVLPATSLGTPTTPDLTPANGCAFATAVLAEIDREEVRILSEVQTANEPRKVILAVHKLSDANLRKSTKDWLRTNCITS